MVFTLKIELDDLPSGNFNDLAEALAAASHSMIRYRNDIFSEIERVPQRGGVSMNGTHVATWYIDED